MRWVAFLGVLILLGGCAGTASYTGPEGGSGQQQGSDGLGGTGAAQCEEKDGGFGGTGCTNGAQTPAPAHKP